MKVTKAILAVALVATVALQGAEAKNLCGVECHDGSTFRQEMTKDQCHCYRGLKCLSWSFQGKNDIWPVTGTPQYDASFSFYNDIGRCKESMATYLNSPVFPSASLDHIKLNIGKKGFTAGVKVIEERQAKEKKARLAEEAHLKKEAELNAFFGGDKEARYAELDAIGQEFENEKTARIQDLTAAQARDARIKRAFAADIEARNQERDAVGAAFAKEKAARVQELAENFNPVHHNLVVSLLKSPSHSTVIRANMGDVNFGFGFHTLAEYKAMSTRVSDKVVDNPEELLNLKRPPMAFLAAIIAEGEALKPVDVMVTEDKQLIGDFNGVDLPIKVKNYQIADDILELRATAAAEAEAAANAAAQAELEFNAATTIQKAFRKHQQAAAEDDDEDITEFDADE